MGGNSNPNPKRYRAMLATFRDRFPFGGIVTELLRVEEGIYIVRAQALVNGTVVLGSGIAGSTTVEDAEDAAIQRALRVAGVDNHQTFPAAEAIAPQLTAPSNGKHYDSSDAQWSSTAPAPMAAVSTPPPPDPVPTTELPPLEMEDLSDLIAQTDVELTRIGWGPKEGRRFLKERFGKQSRQQLDDRELREFLTELQQQPTQRSADTSQAF